MVNYGLEEENVVAVCSCARVSSEGKGGGLCGGGGGGGLRRGGSGGGGGGLCGGGRSSSLESQQQRWFFITFLTPSFRPDMLLGKEYKVNILKSIDEGPFQMGTFQETLAEGNKGALHLGPERPRVYSDLSLEDKDKYNADIRATNILLQGLPKDIYTLINHYIDAKDIWDNVKMLLEEVKLNRGLRDSNYDQLYGYLKQHEAHANENKMMLDRFTQHTIDPLVLMSNVSHQLNQATVPNGRVVVQNVQGQQNRGQGNNSRGAGAAGYEGAQNRVRNANPDKMLLMQAQENGVALDEDQLLFIVGGQDNVVDKDVDEQPVQDLALNLDNVFQADDCDAFDSDVDEAPTA
ncbi:hypothetical protein Tco_0678540 [Tanacetum coccineum]|uniref:Integrase, catalytic region, zinc finger, CCHC-type, peptidase aspartic, catalytic n=1 Tax=Tanacetum coccineum TaxID=301880 RepID=A0ABQ4XGN5_9ASTR